MKSRGDLNPHLLHVNDNLTGPKILGFFKRLIQMNGMVPAIKQTAAWIKAIATNFVTTVKDGLFYEATLSQKSY